ncbi:MAG: ELM1/GtrOC1 family putative glycosyltransferase [Candidatus Omnitrophota bacterium]
MKDSILCITLRILIFIMRFLPIEAWLFFARRLGWLYYYLAGRQNQKALKNLKIAFGQKSLAEHKRIVQQMHMRFAQNFFETLYLSYVDESYVKKYIRFKGLDCLKDALVHKRGIIFLGVHAGSWELSNAACALLLKDSRYAMLSQPQSKHKKIDGLLNGLRESKGVHVIRVDELKKLVSHLSANNILGTIADHGGQDGMAIEFFSKLAMTPIGSVRLAKKLGAKIIIAFMHRIHGPTHEMIFSPYELSVSSDAAADLKHNLTQINHIFQKHICCFPSEYLWFYKRWKHSPQKDILVLSDDKLGHLNQSLALAHLIQDSVSKATVKVVSVEYKNLFCSRLLALIVFLFGRRMGKGFLSLLVTRQTRLACLSKDYDIVVSAGSGVAALNLVMSFEHMAQSFVVMRPGIFSVSKFSMVIAPEHDRLPKRKNVLSIPGSVNTVTADSVKRDFEQLCSVKSELRFFEQAEILKIGLLIGGDSKNYELTPELTDFLCLQIKKMAERQNILLFLTTSRRTPKKVVRVLESHFKKDNSMCRLFVDAAEDNPPGTVGGIIHLSDIVIVSGESISMVSEAASSGKYVVVFKSRCKKAANKVEKFLDLMAQRGHIFLCKVKDLDETLMWIVHAKPQSVFFDTQGVIKEKLKQVLFAG